MSDIPIEKMQQNNAPLTLEPFTFMRVQGWGIVVTSFDGNDDMPPYFVAHAILWVQNGDGVTPIVVPSGIPYRTTEDAAFETFAMGEAFFGSKLNPKADIISSDGNKVGEINMVELITQKDASMQEFFNSLVETQEESAPKVLH